MNTPTPTPSQVIENGHRTFASKIDLLVTERSKELRKASQDLRIEIGRLNNELTAVTEQRDGLRSGIDYASDQLTAVTEQRDRLAEALRECREDSVELLGERDWWQNEPRLDYQKRYQETRDNVTRADEALQSLTTTEP